MSLPRVPPNTLPPPIRWWGNAFYRQWMGWDQLVIVLRLPVWAKRYVAQTDDVRRAQLMLSWRSREGFRYGWRPS